MRIDRMLAITVMMLNRDKITARELADKFEVSLRTIYRDIEAINLAGIPIVSYPGYEGGFGIMANYKIDRQILSLTDMVSILSALKGISAMLDYRELDHTIEKISSLVPESDLNNKKLISEQFAIDVLPWGYRKKERDRLQIIHQAVKEQVLISFCYCNANNQTGERTVEPMTLLFKGYAWYLFAYCHLKNDYRFFRLSRMSGINPLNENFERREKSYTECMDYDLTSDRTIQLVLKFRSAAKTRVEDYFSHELIEYTKNGDLIVRFSIPEDEWVYSTILGFGDDVEVLEPPHLREIIREKAKKISGIYQVDTMLSK